MHSRYEIHPEQLTVIRIDAHGERWDLNAEGEPCETLEDLSDFIRELHRQGAFDATTVSDLLVDVAALA